MITYKTKKGAALKLDRQGFIRLMGDLKQIAQAKKCAREDIIADRKASKR